uniref:Monocyte differentiation antigen CD14 n=1 Tax=Jaculus jaculus TaxID=51337 RepID=A0A8C5KF20_JACJA|nr:monocyte differentiation antigen CD14 [Jaculus jaculus]
MACVPCLLLLSLLRASAASPLPEEPCELDDEVEAIRCTCNFSDPKPDWSSALQCLSAVQVELHGGGRSLEEFLKRVDLDAKPQQYVDVVKSLPWQRLTVAAARVPAPLLASALQMLGYSRLRELTLQDLEVTGTTPTPLLEASGPDLHSLHLRNVTWAARGAWLAELQPWLKPGLQVLTIIQARSLAFSCEQVRPFPALTTLDLSDNPGLGESGLNLALCPHKFPALQVLALRNAGLETLLGVCAALATAGVRPRQLDLSHNSLRAEPGAPKCVWPSELLSLNLSFAGLEEVPKGLPAKLSVLDLSCNRLNRAPRSDELPKVSNLSLDGNPFLDSEPSNPEENIGNSGMVPICASSSLAVGMSGTVALLQGARGFA